MNRFPRLSPSTNPPVAEILSIGPDPSEEGEEVFFTGTGTDDGSIVSYSWTPDLDGVLSNGSEDSFSTDGRSVCTPSPSLSRIISEPGPITP